VIRSRGTHPRRSRSASAATSPRSSIPWNLCARARRRATRGTFGPMLQETLRAANEDREREKPQARALSWLFHRYLDIEAMGRGTWTRHGRSFFRRFGLC
jgi:hypothetical protein